MDKIQRITLHTIAKQVGVSATTVSRVLSGQAARYRISKSTEETVLQTAAELGYLPDQQTRGLRLSRTSIIGLIIPDTSNPFFASLARSIENEARKSGYSIMLCDSQDSTKLEVDSIQILQGRKVDGFIICPIGQEHHHLDRLRHDGVPMVVVDRYFPDLKCPYIVSDNYNGSLEAVNYFIQNGHRSIACIQGLLDTSVNDDRLRGYRDAHEMHSIPVNESLIVGDSFGERNGYIGAKLLLNRTSRPTAIFACSNLTSLGAWRAITEEGLNIPEDISMISFDDQPYSDYLSTPLTTVAQQATEMGQIAFRMLIDQVEGKSNNETDGIVLPTKLIIRESVKKLTLVDVKMVEEKVLESYDHAGKQLQAK